MFAAGALARPLTAPESWPSPRQRNRSAGNEPLLSPALPDLLSRTGGLPARGAPAPDVPERSYLIHPPSSRKPSAAAERGWGMAELSARPSKRGRRLGGSARLFRESPRAGLWLSHESPRPRGSRVGTPSQGQRMDGSAGPSTARENAFEPPFIGVDRRPIGGLGAAGGPPSMLQQLHAAAAFALRPHLDPTAIFSAEVCTWACMLPPAHARSTRSCARPPSLCA